jgi:membrane associated rhomboid family serine protease
MEAALVFFVAVIAGCLTGAVLVLWSRRRRKKRSLGERKAPFA